MGQRSEETVDGFLCLKHQPSQRQDHWIGSRENLQETIVFPMTYGAFLHSFP